LHHKGLELPRKLHSEQTIHSYFLADCLSNTISVISLYKFHKPPIKLCTVFKNSDTHTLLIQPFSFYCSSRRRWLLKSFPKKVKQLAFCLNNMRTKTLYRDYSPCIADFCATIFFEYLLEKLSFLTKQSVENKFWSSYERLESTGETKLMIKFYLCLHNFSEIYFQLCIS